MVEWHFEKKQRRQKSRDPMQGKFFTNDNIDDGVHALVREAIQNSLDARLDKNYPVRVRFYLGCHKAEDGVMSNYISADAWKHFSAENNGLNDPPRPDSNCHFLVCEDFNTKGLTGNEEASEPEESNAFYYFLRAEGQSGKHGEARGRHGIGKYVFPQISRIRTFIAVTVREQDESCLVVGQCVLKSHHVDAELYTPDGWWGEFADDGFQLPVKNDNELFQRIKMDFSFQRERDQGGLSLVMPYVDENITPEKVAGNVMAEYFWPIVRQQLTVEVESHENPEPMLLDHTTIEKLVGEIKGELLPLVKLATTSLDRNRLAVIDDLVLPEKPGNPDMSKLITKEKARQIQELLDQRDKVVCVKIPLYVQKKGGDAEEAFFRVYLARDGQDSKRSPVYVREGISIPNGRRGEIQGFVSVITIENGALATFLGDSENPAHTEWEKNADGLKKYKRASVTIDFVRQSARKILDELSQDEEEKDRTVLSDIFYLNLPENDDDVPPTRKKKPKPDVGSDVEPPPSIPPSSPRHYSLSKLEGGFVLKGAETATGTVRSYTVTVAYDFEGASKARALKKYHKNDFDLGKGKDVERPVADDNVRDMEVSGNMVTFTAPSNNFRLEVRGFDHHRDIIVDVSSRELKDEAL